MPTDWLDKKDISFHALLLLERVQLSWFSGWLPESELGVALQANPAVEWYMRHKCPELNPWLDQVMMQADELNQKISIRDAELAVLQSIDDLLTYVLDPSLYDTLPFLGWDSAELTGLVDFETKIVIDVGSGTGRLALIAATSAHAVYAVEPVANLRYYLRDKASKLGYTNVYPVDGIITKIPFHDDFADITMGGHVFGDVPEDELAELNRVTKPGGMIILCPGNVDRDSERHKYLIENGFMWSRFEEPGDGLKRKYWKVLDTIR
jgi:SAM-dependent methyltransferase